MRVLVTGGTGVIGEAVLQALLDRHHEVRVLSRQANDEAAAWPKGVEARPGEVTSRGDLEGAATGCDAVVHVVGIVTENPPERTYDRVNVQGTRNVVAEAERAGVRRFVHVSALGADWGASEYHKSKLRAEKHVRGFGGEWVILRPGNVYGPGDEIVSLLLKMVRTLPAVPVIDGGHRFQPIWYRDLGEVLARAVDMPEVVRRTLEVAGSEHTTLTEVLDRLAAVTGRAPLRMPIPGFLASLGAGTASLLGFGLPITDTHLTMPEENVIRPGGENALTSVFGMEPTPLAEGLRRLVDLMPESLPSSGVGPLRKKRFWADISGSRFRARELRDVFRLNLAKIMPLDGGGGAPRPFRKGTTLSVALPMRGVVSMRVEEVTPDRLTLSTVDGHPLTGIVSFHFIERGEQVRFEVEILARAANVVDRVVTDTVGGIWQDANWRAVVQRTVDVSGGAAKGGIESESKRLDQAETRDAEEWAKILVTRRKRATSPARPRAVRAAAASETDDAVLPGPTNRVGRPSPAGTGNGRRSPTGSGSGRTSGRAGRAAGVRKEPGTPSQ